MTEKEIIKQIKNDINVGEFYGITEDSIKGLLDLYNKQKEEIKELKAITKMYDSYIGEKMPLNSNIIIADREYFMNGTFVNKFISKDKIREKIEEEEEHLDFENTEMEDHTIAILNELLEER